MQLQDTVRSEGPPSNTEAINKFRSLAGASKGTEAATAPDFAPTPVQERGSLLVLALLAFAVGGTSGLLGAVFRLVLERTDRFRGAVIDWAHGKEITGFVLVIGISAIATGLAAWLVRKFAPGAKGSGISEATA